MSETTTDDARVYLIEKRGLYYRPEAKGYTGIKDEAGRYSLAEVAEHMPNMDSANQDGMSFIHEDEAPEYTRACYHDLKERHQANKLADAAARIEALEAENEGAMMIITAEVLSLRRKVEALERELAEANADAERLAELCATVHGSFGGGLVITFSDGDIDAYEQALAAHRARTEGKG